MTDSTSAATAGKTEATEAAKAAGAGGAAATIGLAATALVLEQNPELTTAAPAIGVLATALANAFLRFFRRRFGGA